MSLNELDLNAVEASKDFGLAKPTATRLRIREVELKAVDGKEYTHKINAYTEFEDASSVEPLDPTTAVSAPIVSLYTHNTGSLGMVRRFVEAYGGSWADVIATSGSTNAEKIFNYIQNTLVGRTADAKLTINPPKDGYEASQKVRFIVPKAA